MAIKLLWPLIVSLTVLGCGRDIHSPGELSHGPRTAAATSQPHGDKQILFGDLHVHTSYSMDAFEKGASFMRGEGLHPPADACDFARYCSQLDFWSINDHALSITPQRWRDTRDTIRQCNALAGDADNPDVVSFLGWEWTQIGATPASHYGHKNVILKSLDDADIPPRVIQAPPTPDQFNVELDSASLLRDWLTRPFRDRGNFSEHIENLRFNIATFSVAACDPDIATRDLPLDCREGATTPRELFERLDAWTDDYLVIPHGNTWGLYTPPASDWYKQLAPGFNHRAQRLLEVYSGHGSAEQYRSWRALDYDPSGSASCPPPADGFIPCCWQAGEILRQQCQDPSSTQCQQQVLAARQNFVTAGASGYLTLAGASTEDWLNCGQCPDCFLPAFDHRPGTSAQAALASTRFDDDGEHRFRVGFIASSDNHSARPGSGYKELRRIAMTDVQGATREWADVVAADKSQRLRSYAPQRLKATPRDVYNRDRVSSFFYTGGLVAVHSSGRDREALWQALDRREVYGTSGPRILLWFDLLDARGAVEQAMGGELLTRAIPRFRIRAMGALEQQPGCPGTAVAALGNERLQRLCYGECYNPGSQRHSLDRLEVVRVRPQRFPGEDMAALIDDPWRVFPCEPGQEMCSASFSDPDYVEQQRDTVYYVRAIQVATEAINGAGLRCEYDQRGDCVAVNPCHGDYRQDRDDDCLAEVAERAWSSPIYLDYPSGQAAGRTAR